MKNELDGNGVLTFDKDISELVIICLGNDLNTISMITENLPLKKYQQKGKPSKKRLGKYLKSLIK